MHEVYWEVWFYLKSFQVRFRKMQLKLLRGQVSVAYAVQHYKHVHIPLALFTFLLSLLPYALIF